METFVVKPTVKCPACRGTGENKVTLMAGCRLIGDISSYHLVIDEGSDFEGLSKKISPSEKAIEPEDVSDDSAKVAEPEKKNLSAKGDAQKKNLKL